MFWLILLAVVIVVVFIMVVSLSAKFENVNSPDNDKSMKTSQRPPVRVKHQIQPINQNITLPNNELINKILKHIEIINNVNNLSSEICKCWYGISIKTETSSPIEKGGVIKFSASYSTDIKNTKLYNSFKKIIDSNFIIDYFSSQKLFTDYTTSFGYINGNPEAFFCQLGKVISNVYPNIEFLDCKRFLCNGSSGAFIEINRESTFERR